MNSKTSQVQDTRTNKVFFLPISQFVDPIITERLALKKQKGNRFSTFYFFEAPC
jgi:hypothetical protein